MILDTNALSAEADGGQTPEPILRQADEIAVPAIVLGEYRFGIRRSRYRKNTSIGSPNRCQAFVFYRWRRKPPGDSPGLAIISSASSARFARMTSGSRHWSGSTPYIL